MRRLPSPPGRKKNFCGGSQTLWKGKKISAEAPRPFGKEKKLLRRPPNPSERKKIFCCHHHALGEGKKFSAATIMRLGKEENFLPPPSCAWGREKIFCRHHHELGEGKKSFAGTIMCLGKGKNFLQGLSNLVPNPKSSPARNNTIKEARFMKSSNSRIESLSSAGKFLMFP